MSEKFKPHPLRIERELRGWSQAKVAEAIGTNVRTVIRWEQGKTLPFPFYRERLCALFGKNARELGLLAERDEYPHDLDTFQGNHESELSLPHSAPAPSTSFWKVPPVLSPLIGRVREMNEIQALLTSVEVRLLTVLGTGGIGKTHLSIQLAHNVSPLFADGICFVDLTAVSDPEQVLSLIAHELNLPDEHIPSYERVQRFLHEKQMLLILDNFEQVVQAAPVLERLLAACPYVKMLVTSRIVLHSAMERQYRLSPLTVPDLQHLPDSTAIGQCASVELFAQRASTIQPTFHVTEANAVALAEICVHLDGVPLAIELAAARIKLLPPHVLLPRLSQSLQVLTKGLPTLPARHHTLRDTIRWSYDLLNADEQHLFRLLSVFVDRFTIQAIESIFASVMEGTTKSMTTALDGLDSLIDKSLVQLAEPEDEAGEPQLAMLETIREYGRECLLKRGEMGLARRSHAEYYLQLAEEAAQELQGEQQSKWLDRLDQEHGNLHAAMQWMLELPDAPGTGSETTNRINLALRMGSALGMFWSSRGYLDEGWKFMEQALSSYEGEVMPVLASAYGIASQLIMHLGNVDRAEILIERSIEGYRALGDRANLARVLRSAGWIAHQRGQIARAYSRYEESLALFRDLDDHKGIAYTMINMAFILQTQGDCAQAATMLEEVITLQRALKNKAGIANTIYQLAQVLFAAEEHPPIKRIRALLDEGLELARELRSSRDVASLQGLSGWVAFSQGNLAEARRLMEDCLRFYQQGGDREITGQYLAILGEIVTAQGDYRKARALFEESMAVGKELRSKTETTALALEGMAQLAILQENHPWAVRLLSVAAHLRATIQVAILPGQRPAYERKVEQARIFLGEKAFSVLWDEGATLSPDEVWDARYRPLPHLQESRVGTPLAGVLRAPSKKKAPLYPAGLSAREVEVLRLVAQGRSDAQVAKQLIISTRTVTSHLTSIYNKLGVNARSAAVRFAAEHHLL
jgi:predicted ATPase/DNA-binding CsgD family transcriptional regulator/transcriptional regulator with XRE-family HTH domain